MEKNKPLGSSFRDPAGFVYQQEDDRFHRAITQYGRPDYELLISSGLYDELAKKKWLIRHTEDVIPHDAGIYRSIFPEQIPFISYPYEWCFSQLQDAAILTLQIQLEAVGRGMSLKDANPFNIQWREGSPVLIDTLSFEEWKERPWFAYRQFCETFLAPLAMMAFVKADFNKYLSVDLGGLDLGACSRSLPFKTRFNPGCLAHLHLHALSQEKFDSVSNGSNQAKKAPLSLKFSKSRMVSLVRSLLDFTGSLRLKKRKTIFRDYYADCGHYSKTAEDFKMQQVQAWASEPSVSNAAQALDLGSNNGKFSRIFSKKKILCVSADSDPYCVEENYLLSKKENDEAMLPLLLDLANPSQDLGWAGGERTAFFKRAAPGLVLALALVHHLRITHGISMNFIANFFLKTAPALIIEFVPKSDPMVRKLLINRDDIFHDYDEQNFETALGRGFTIAQKVRIPETQRTLYFLRRR